MEEAIFDAWKGFVDIAELNLSNEDFRLSIDKTKASSIAGTTEIQGVCEKGANIRRVANWRKHFQRSQSYSRRVRVCWWLHEKFRQDHLAPQRSVMTVIPVDDPAECYLRKGLGLLTSRTKINWGMLREIQRPFAEGNGQNFSGI